VRKFENMNALIEKREIKPVIDKVYPFAQAHEAYARLESAVHFGKLVIAVEP
jgi:NADPH:quinone reductase-like Zn-dependent oxidoreductase